MTDRGAILLLQARKLAKAAANKGRHRSGSRLFPDTNMHRPILAIDGEGVTDKNGDHRYIMLAASDGTYVSSHQLSTQECFDYLLSLPKRHLIVGFSLNYDIAKWIQSMSKAAIESLWRNGRVEWRGYRVRYAPSKQINISKGKQSVHIYDVFGFYQRSFVAALAEWKVGTAEQVERITEMKASRSEFGEESFKEILAYCQEECTLLVELVGKLRQAIYEGDIPMRQWYGAGAIASAILEKEHVRQHLRRQPPEKYSLSILQAYFGGRFELRKSGRIGNVYLYDIRSAYPYIASTLPCQSHLIYSERTGYAKGTWNLHKIRWELDQRIPWGPFPFRHERTRQILHPSTGEGWYHASEVAAGMRLYPDKITVERTIVIESRCPEGCPKTPFRFIPDYFKYRQTLKEKGSQAQLTLKLGLNSLYGKTAQGVGFGQKKPPFQSYLWAGMITAGTRAMLLDTIAQNPEAIIWTATDGIASTEPLDLPESNDLGGWDAYTADWVFSVQPGVYQVCRDGKIENRTRGFGKREAHFDEIQRAYLDNPIWGSFSYKTTRFVGIGGALMRKDFWKYFGKWIEMPRKLTFYPSKRIPALILDGSEMGLTMQDLEHMTQDPPILSYPPSGVSGQPESAPYHPKATWVDQWERESDDETLDVLLDSEQP